MRISISERNKKKIAIFFCNYKLIRNIRYRKQIDNEYEEKAMKMRFL